MPIVILFLLFITATESDRIKSLREFTESEAQVHNSEGITDSEIIITHWQKIKNKTFISKEESIIGQIDTTSLSDDMLGIYYVVVGDEYLKGEFYNDTEAFRYYNKAFNLYKESKNEIIGCEVVKRIIDYAIFVELDTSLVRDYISIHQSISYDSLEVLWNQYYDLRYRTFVPYRNDTAGDIAPIEWNKAIRACKENNYKRLYIEFVLLKAVYLVQIENNFEAALEEYDDLLIYARGIDEAYYNDLTFTIYGNIGNTYMQQGHYVRALQTFNKIPTAVLNIQKPQNISLLLGWKAECNDQLGTYKSAYDNLVESMKINTEIKTTQHAIAINEIEEKYQNEVLKVDLMETDLLKNQYLTFAIIAAGLFLLAIASYFFYMRISRLKRQNLEKSIENLEKESLLKAINAKIDGEESERRRVASVLHDNISANLAASRLHLNVIRQFSKENKSLNKTDELLGQISSQVRELSHELYPPALFKLDFQEALAGLCEKYTNDQIQFLVEGHNLANAIVQEKKVKLYFIVQEILNNVLKHSQASRCHIKTILSSTECTIVISDNGIGGINMSQNKHTGMGLYSVQARIQDMDGRLTIQSPAAQGTNIQLSLPVDIPASIL